LTPTTVVKTGPGILIPSDGNTYTGATIISGGTIRIGKIASSLEPSSIGASFGNPESLVFNGGGKLLYPGATTQTDRGFTVNGAGGVIEITDAAAALTFQGLVVGTGGVGKTGPGQLILASVNTYEGDTIVEGGSLQVGDKNQSTQLNPGDFTVAAGSQLIFSRNTDNVAFVTQSIDGAGDVLFTGQSTGYFTFRTNYGGRLTYTGKTIVNYDPDAGGTWFERTLWLEKDDLLPHSSVVELQSGKIYLRNNTGFGETIAGLSGDATTRIATDQQVVQKLTVDVASGKTYVFDGEIGLDPALGASTANIAITKTGPGTQVLGGPSTFSGGLNIEQGTLRIGATTASATAVGSGPVKLGSATTNGTLDLNGQTEIVNGLSVAAGANPNGQMIGNSSLLGDATLVSTGTSTFGGVIVDGIAGGNKKTGLNVTMGELTLTNASTYSGNTSISGGKVVLRPGSSLGNTAITVSSGSSLAVNPGAGAISTAGTVSLENGSIFDMADGALGTFSVNGLGTSFLFGSEPGASARLNFELGSSGTDRITIANAATVMGTNTIGISILGTSLTPSNTYTLISSASGLSGTFLFANGTQETSILVGTTTYRLTLQNSATATTVSVLSGALATWGGAGSTTNTTAWATGSNWSGGAVPGAVGSTTNTDTVVFSSNPANPAPVVDSGRNIQNIIFDTAALGNVNLGGSTLTLSGGGIIQVTPSVTQAPAISAPLAIQGDYQILSNATAPVAITLSGDIASAIPSTLTLGGSNTADNTISGLISESVLSLGITKRDGGKWVLSNFGNSFTGPVRVLGGTLSVPSIGNSFLPSALGASGAAPDNLILNSATLQYTGDDAFTDRSFTVAGTGGSIDVS
jgi:fibronectin-binding autotransporter adhesin